MSRQCRRILNVVGILTNRVIVFVMYSVILFILLIHSEMSASLFLCFILLLIVCKQSTLIVGLYIELCNIALSVNYCEWSVAFKSVFCSMISRIIMTLFMRI